MKIFVTIKSFKSKLLTFYCIFLTNLLKKVKLKYSLISLPKKKKKITLLKSPHVHKKAREQFELKLYKKTLFIDNYNNFLHIKHLLINKPKLLNITINYMGK